MGKVGADPGSNGGRDEPRFKSVVSKIGPVDVLGGWGKQNKENIFSPLDPCTHRLPLDF
jgi:hypothetical protein